MAANSWLKLDKLMRSLHMYTGLFLAPWMIIYALSAFYLNHFRSMSDALDIPQPTFQFISETPFEPGDVFPNNPDGRARAVLEHVGLEGPFRFQGVNNANITTLLRPSGSGNYRVTYYARAGAIKVEQQGPFSTWRFINYLHFRHGYGENLNAYLIWAVAVDLTAFSMLLWVGSGLYIWARMRNKRFWGSVSLAAGVSLFAVLVVYLLM
ncbi:MAG: hypothetical protein ACYTGQ_11570 [Planctomycetota bacterium]|jgi:hypothetical protein